ncbi:response regulator transcription factor [Microtetraspora malaysiensis]|uniref:response regulator transcription factor n=1 Tax=Microtetraspora malaysiensis TaxID=161358 RepID=UPI0008324E8B
MSETIDILIADDQAMIRAGLRLVIGTQPDLMVTGEAADGRAAVELARRLRPDVVLLDIAMPRLDGLAAARLILAKLGLRDRAQAVRYAYESGVVRPGDAGSVG